jgi:hypothetical protein
MKMCLTVFELSNAAKHDKAKRRVFATPNSDHTSNVGIVIDRHDLHIMQSFSYALCANALLFHNINITV